MWNVDLVNLEGHNCYDSLIIALLKYLRYDYSLLYLNRFQNVYLHSPKGKLSNRLSRNFYMNDNTLLSKYIGINVLLLKEKSKLHEFIQKEISKAPLIVWLDPYYCYWTTMYKRKHYTHSCFILDSNQKENLYICGDIYFAKSSYIQIPFHEMEVLIQEIEYVEIIAQKNLTLKEKLVFLTECINSLSSFNTRNDRINLIEYFKYTFNIENDIGRKDELDISSLLLLLLWFSQDKKSFLIGLQKIDELQEKKIFIDLCKLLEYSEKNFITLKNVLLKAAITKKLDFQIVEEIINNIYDLDIDINNLLHYILSV